MGGGGEQEILQKSGWKKMQWKETTRENGTHEGKLVMTVLKVRTGDRRLWSPRNVLCLHNRSPLRADYDELRRGGSVPWSYVSMRKGVFTGTVFVHKYLGTIL
jgi:hypothetical protein